MTALPGLTRPWEIFLVHHSHTDLGYTEPQPVIFRKQADYIAQALDHCSATDHLPEGERFVWTCEVSWAIRQFLKRYPEQAEEFFQRVREGRIEVTGIYLQLTDLYGEALLEQTISYATDLGKSHGFDVVTAMQNDVNGWAWGLPRILASRGVKYFDTGINETRSLGVRPKPSLFYWASPDGSRVLTWNGEIYIFGNGLQVSDPQAEEWLFGYLQKLESSGYPHSAVEMRVHGTCVDNAPPSLWICDTVRRWNAKWDYPRLRLCTPRTWFNHVETSWPEEIPEVRAGWPDWWADGNGSAIYESMLVRRAQADMATAEAAASIGGQLDPDRLETVRDAAALFAEHTWGAWCSTDDPEALESKAQWNMKAGYAYQAAIESSSLLKDTVHSCIDEPGDALSVFVFNPLDWPRTGLVEVTIPDHLVLGAEPVQVLAPRREDEGPALCLIDEENAETVSTARIPTLTGSMRYAGQMVCFIARNVPAKGWKRYRVMLGNSTSKSCTVTGESVLENAHFRVSLDPVTGGIASLVDIATGHELVSPCDYTLNQHIYEFIDSPKGREALCEWGRLLYDTPFVRRTPAMSTKPGQPMPFGGSLVAQGGGSDVPSIKSEVIIYDEIPRVDIVNTVRIQASKRSEAVYHAFPLGRKDPTVYLEVPGAAMRPGLDQIPGTATDWYGVQRYFAVSNQECTTVVATPDVPLVQVNGINTGKWQETLPPHNGQVMSWVLNNYWFTNFPATQSGTVRFRYSISNLPGPFDLDAAKRFGLTINQPLVGIVLPNGGSIKRLV